jgi:hypothetical protein
MEQNKIIGFINGTLSTGEILTADTLGSHEKSGSIK